MILSAVLQAIGQFGTDRRFRAVFWLSIGLTLLVLFAFSAVVIWGVGALIGDSVTIPLIGTVGWVDNALSIAAIPLMMVLSIFLMVPVASAVLGLFLDRVAQVVEDRHYPGLGAASDVPVADQLRDTLGFLGTMLAANLVALVLYIFFVPLAPLIFWALNGFLLGREYFTMAAIRRVGRAEAKRLRRRHLPAVWATGVIMAVPLSVPILNLLVPVLGAAAFTHVFHGVSGRS
jgi:uncharacterized protein involved in cysteine biosynthesis